MRAFRRAARSLATLDPERSGPWRRPDGSARSRGSAIPRPESSRKPSSGGDPRLPAGARAGPAAWPWRRGPADPRLSSRGTATVIPTGPTGAAPSPRWPGPPRPSVTLPGPDRPQSPAHRRPRLGRRPPSRPAGSGGRGATSSSRGSFRILTGIEVDILEDGSLDQDEELLAGLDLVVASVHSKLSMERPAMTRRMLSAIENPHTDILGHCTGRILVGRGRKQSTFDPDAVFEACARTGTAVEINSRPERRDPPAGIAAAGGGARMSVQHRHRRPCAWSAGMARTGLPAGRRRSCPGRAGCQRMGPNPLSRLVEGTPGDVTGRPSRGGPDSHRRPGSGCRLDSKSEDGPPRALRVNRRM